MGKIDALEASTLHRPSMPLVGQGLIVASLVFAIALAGILARPIDFLSSFWPANAILLGIMVRNPALSHPIGWLGATAGYVAADLVTGGALALTLWLTAGNLVSALTGFLLFQRLGVDDRRLRRPLAILHLFSISIVAALATATVSAGALVTFFGRGLLDSFAVCVALELATHLIVLPMVLTAPSATELRSFYRERDISSAFSLGRSAPAAALLLSLAIGTIVGGPGAVAIPIPAILWCALSYGLFFTATMMFFVGLWQSMLLYSLLHADAGNFLHSIFSIRLGAGLFALGPLMVASINTARNDLMAALDRAANQDLLTQALSRRAFLNRGDAAMASCPGDMAGLILDIDHFKQVNDRYGHAAGDAVLTAAGATIARDLRANDLSGRLGGEEFAVLLRGVAPAQALAIAEGLRETVEAMSVTLDSGEHLTVTVSIGVAFGGGATSSLASLLKCADDALYEAKRTGRNRVVQSPAILS